MFKFIFVSLYLIYIIYYSQVPDLYANKNVKYIHNYAHKISKDKNMQKKKFTLEIYIFISFIVIDNFN